MSVGDIMRTGTRLIIWSDDEKQYLRDHQEKSVVQIRAGFCEEFGQESRTYSAIINQLTNLGLRNKGRRRRWSDEEKEYLSTHLEDDSRVIAAKLGKSYSSVIKRRKKLSPESIQARPGWKPDETIFLRSNCSIIPLPLLSAKLERSCAQIEGKMGKLSLPLKILTRCMESAHVDRLWQSWEHVFLKLNCDDMSLRLLARSLNRLEWDVVVQLRDLRLTCKFSKPKVVKPKPLPRVVKPKLLPKVGKPKLLPKVDSLQAEILSAPTDGLSYQLSMWEDNANALVDMEKWCLERKMCYCIVFDEENGYAIFRPPLSVKG